ncbi:type B 50S ribosomal protein L31 [Kineococcus sp. SYSU DK001]|uniref:type B 50S ribosomal protein L31 n=1 Tax=Kineococcus sp. SYSU DK001 TaxID=3383122 RepID=UPI003D7DA124
MQTEIHPAYGDVVFRDKSAGTAFLSRSTLVSRAGLPTIEWEDGNTYPVVDVDVSAASHPFWTGTSRVLDTEGRVEKFRRRYAQKG